jgi:hypothetical protein
MAALVKRGLGKTNALADYALDVTINVTAAIQEMRIAIVQMLCSTMDQDMETR